MYSDSTSYISLVGGKGRSRAKTTGSTQMSSNTSSHYSMHGVEGSTSGTGTGAGTGLRISMGYRGDCTKCKEGVVGHYTHWV